MLSTAAAIAALLLVCGLIDRLLIGTNFAITSYDNDTGWFSIGLARLSGAPLTDFHQPSFLFNILSGAFVGLVHLDGTDRPFVQYLQLAFAVQVAAVLTAAVLIARMIHRGVFQRGSTLLAIAMAASMPTAVVFSGHYSNYFLLIMTALVIGLMINAWLAGQDEILAPLGGLVGLVVANFFPFLAVLLTIVAALLAAGLTHGPRLAAGRPLIETLTQALERHKSLAMFAMLTAAVMSYRLPLVAPSAAAATAGVLFCFALVVAAPAAMLWIGSRVEAIAPSVWRFWWTLLCGWWLGALWLAPYYLTSFGWRLSEVYNALITEGILLRKLQEMPIVWLGLLPFLAFGLIGALMLLRRRGVMPGAWIGIGITALGLLAPAGIIAVYRTKLISIPWLWLTLLPFVAYAMLIPHLKGRDLATVDRSHLMAAIVFGLGTPLTLGVALLYGTSNPEPALAVRLMIGTMALSIAAACYILDRLVAPGRRAQTIVTAIAFICAASVLTTFLAARKAIDHNAAIGRAIDASIAAFMSAAPDGLVLCARDEAYSRVCSVAYAYNSYRTPESRRLLPTKRLYDKRVLWLSIEELLDPVQGHLDGHRGPILVVGARERLLGSGNPDYVKTLPGPEAGDFVAYRIPTPSR